MEKTRFSKYIIERRTALGISQKELAEALGYTPQAISRFESLDSQFPLDLVSPLCRLLNCSIDDLYNRADKPKGYAAIPNRIYKEMPVFCKRLRLDHDLTQTEMGKILGVSDRTIRSIEAGETLPSFQTLDKLCQYADCLPSEIKAVRIAPLPVTKRKWFKPTIFTTAGVIVALSVVVPTTLVFTDPDYNTIDQMANNYHGGAPSGIRVDAFEVEFFDDGTWGSRSPIKDFLNIGDTVMLCPFLVDGNELYGLESVEWTYEPLFPCGEYDLTVQPTRLPEYREQGWTEVTLNSANNGASFIFTAIIDGRGYPNCCVLRYHDQNASQFTAPWNDSLAFYDFAPNAGSIIVREDENSSIDWYGHPNTTAGTTIPISFDLWDSWERYLEELPQSDIAAFMDNYQIRIVDILQRKRSPFQEHAFRFVNDVENGLLGYFDIETSDRHHSFDLYIGIPIDGDSGHYLCSQNLRIDC